MPSRRLPLISATFGCAGRTDATHAALILADAYATLNEAVTLIRVTLPGEACLPERRYRPEEVTVAEHAVASAGEADALLADEIAAAAAAGGHVILDLPERCLADGALRSRIDVAVMVVGPTPLDEHMAACALADAEAGIGAGTPDAGLHDPGGTVRPAPLWLLGCGRSGGSPAAAASRPRWRASRSAPQPGARASCRRSCPR
ncbi:hypothetical protein ACU4GA_24280 [Methylobacterium oryzae CBMB20]